MIKERPIYKIGGFRFYGFDSKEKHLALILERMIGCRNDLTICKNTIAFLNNNDIIERWWVDNHVQHASFTIETEEGTLEFEGPMEVSSQ